MTTPSDEPDVVETLASMRPHPEALDRVWTQSRRQAARQRALTSDASGRLGHAHPASRGGAGRWIGAGVAVAAVGATAFLVLPGSLASKPVPAVPAATATATPTERGATASPEPGVDLAKLTVSTAGWKRFSSPEYPITFAYPADWELHFARYTPTTAKAEQLTDAGIVDGCAVDGCAAYVSPPGQNIEGGHSVVLMRAGFLGQATGGSYAGAKVLASVPDLKVWTSPTAASPVTAAIVTRSANGFCVSGCSPEDDFGPPYEYLLSTADLANDVAVGATNPAAAQPEAVFSFGTNWGPEGRQARTVATILASSRPNPDFSPTQPAKDSSGRHRFWVYDSMAAPTLGADVSGWKALAVPDGNISLRVPPNWTVHDAGDGIMNVTAPSGYIVDVLTNGKAELACQVTSRWRPSERLSTLQGLAGTDADGVSRPVEVWWQDGTWSPVEVRLSLVASSDAGVVCSQSHIDYGGKRPVYVGSADNSVNPTRAELDQAVAILASVQRRS